MFVEDREYSDLGAMLRPVEVEVLPMEPKKAFFKRFLSFSIPMKVKERHGHYTVKSGRA